GAMRPLHRECTRGGSLIHSPRPRPRAAGPAVCAARGKSALVAAGRKFRKSRYENPMREHEWSSARTGRAMSPVPPRVAVLLFGCFPVVSAGRWPPDRGGRQEQDERGDSSDRQTGADLERSGVVPIDEPVLSRPDQGTTHRPVGPENLGGPA